MQTSQDMLELKALNEDKNAARYEWSKIWRDLPLSFRLTHNANGKSAYSTIAFMVISLMALMLISAWVIVPMHQPGGISYHLENGVNYECLGHDWHGNTSQMKMVAGQYARYYYCPVDGRLIGCQPYFDPLP